MIGLIKGTMRSKKALAGLPLPIASFRTNGNSPLTACKVSITPVQSGSGDPSPSNPRPISGWDSVKVSAVKQLFNGTLEQGSFNTGTGEKFPSTTRVRSVDDIPLPSGSYVLNNLNGWQFVLYVYDLEGNFKVAESYTSWKNNPLSFSLVANRKINFAIRNDTNTTIVPSDVVGLTLYDSTVGQTATIPLPHTVYGGELDVVSGSGSETILGFNLKDISWTQNTYSQNIFNGALPAKAKSQLTGYMAEEYKNTDSTSLINEDFSIAISSARTVVYVHDSRYNGVAEFMAGVNSKMAYELDTSTTLTTTPVALQARNGQNNVWADAGEMSEIGFAVHQQYIGR